MMHFKVSASLPEDAAAIREEVFVREQGFSDEFDEIDESASHIVAYEGDAALAVCRFFWSEERRAYVIRRLAVRRKFRGRAIGSAVLHAAEDAIAEMGGRRVSLGAQTHAGSFCEAQGYTAVGEEYMDEHCLHIWMCKDIGSRDAGA